MLALLDSTEPPEAMLASNGLMMMHIVRALNTAKIRVPQDMGLVGFDNEAWTELVGDGLTVIEQPTGAIGSSAMSLILDRVEASAAPPQKIVLGGRLVVRGSSRRQPATPMQFSVGR